MDNENDERELVPVRVSSNKPPGKEETLDNTHNPEEIERQVIPRRWCIF